MRIKRDTTEYQVGQKIVDAVDEVLFPERRSLLLSLNSKKVFAAPPMLSKIKLREIEKVQRINELTNVPPLHRAEYVEKIERSKHVEMHHFHKETKGHRDRPIRLGTRTRSTGSREHGVNRAKSDDWMQQHGEELPFGAA